MIVAQQTIAFSTLIKCPACKKDNELQEMDCLGACDGYVFCGYCVTEFDPETLKKHDARRCDGRKESRRQAKHV